MTEFVHFSKLESVEELPGSSAETAKYWRRVVLFILSPVAQLLLFSLLSATLRHGSIVVLA